MTLSEDFLCFKISTPKRKVWSRDKAQDNEYGEDM